MANTTMTVTIDTGEWTYLDASGVPHVVTNGQTFTAYSTDTGDGAIYRPLPGATVKCTDGTSVTIHGYNNTQNVVVAAGDTAVTNNNTSLGEWVMSSSADNIQETWKCTGLDLDDADNVAEITAARFEKVKDPTQVFTWTAVTVSSA